MEHTPSGWRKGEGTQACLGGGVSMLRKTSHGDVGGRNGSKLAPEWIFIGLNFSDESSCTEWTADSSTASAVASHGHALGLEWTFLDAGVLDEHWGTGRSVESRTIETVVGLGHMLAL